MDIKKRRRFLFISNIVISVICIASILGYFLMPVFRAEFTAELTPEAAEQIAQSLTEQNGQSNKNTAFENIGDIRPIVQNVIRSIGGAGLKISFSTSFSSSSFIGALFDRSPERVETLIDESVDQLIDNAKEIISTLITSVASAAAKEVVKMQVGEMIKADGGESFENFMEDIGEEKTEKIDGLIDKLINAIMDENATVSSVTETALESADEVQQLLLGIDKYADLAGSYGDEEKSNVRKMCEGVLGTFADESGKLQFKEVLISMLLELMNDAISNGGINLSGIGGDINIAYTPNTLTSSETRRTASVEELTQQLKTKIKTLFYDAANGKLPDFVLSLMAVSGALILVCLFLLFYPILRTLTNIKSDNPGFVLGLPIVGGLLPFTFLVIIPSLGPAVLKGLLSGKVFKIPEMVSAISNSVYISYFSGTVTAFFAAIVIFIFGFFYSYQRRALKKELLTIAPAPEPVPEPAPETKTEEE